MIYIILYATVLLAAGWFAGRLTAPKASDFILNRVTAAEESEEIANARHLETLSAMMDYEDVLVRIGSGNVGMPELEAQLVLEKVRADLRRRQIEL